MSSTHASNNATRIEKTMLATSQYRPPSPTVSRTTPATTNGSVAIWQSITRTTKVPRRPGRIVRQLLSRSSWMVTTQPHAAKPTPSTSAPIRIVLCPGTSSRTTAVSTATNRTRASAARPGRPERGSDSIFSRLIETPTNTSPVRTPAAPAWARKKSCHSSIYLSPSPRPYSPTTLPGLCSIRGVTPEESGNVPTQNRLPINHAFGRSAIAQGLPSWRRGEERDTCEQDADIPTPTSPTHRRNALTVLGLAPGVRCVPHSTRGRDRYGRPGPLACSDRRCIPGRQVHGVPGDKRGRSSV